MANALLVNNPNSEIDLPLLVIQFDNIEEMQSLRLLTRNDTEDRGYRRSIRDSKKSWAVEDPEATDRGIYEVMSKINVVLHSLK